MPLDLMAVNDWAQVTQRPMVLASIMALDGETIRGQPCARWAICTVVLKRWLSKAPLTMVLPYTDRLNYCSSIMNNVGFL